MPKTMTFDRQDLEIIRKLLRSELKRSQRVLDRLSANGADSQKINKAIVDCARITALVLEAQRPVMVTRVNLMSGKEYQEAEDTPLSCSPASETYWSM